MRRRTGYRPIKHTIGDATYEIAYLGHRVKVYRRSPMGELRSVGALEAQQVVMHYEKQQAAQKRNQQQAERELRAMARARARKAEQERNRWYRRLGRWLRSRLTWRKAA